MTLPAQNVVTHRVGDGSHRRDLFFARAQLLKSRAQVPDHDVDVVVVQSTLDEVRVSRAHVFARAGDFTASECNRVVAGGERNTEPDALLAPA